MSFHSIYPNNKNCVMGLLINWGIIVEISILETDRDIKQYLPSDGDGVQSLVFISPLE